MKSNVVSAASTNPQDYQWKRGNSTAKVADLSDAELQQALCLALHLIVTTELPLDPAALAASLTRPFNPDQYRCKLGVGRRKRVSELHRAEMLEEICIHTRTLEERYLVAESMLANREVLRKAGIALSSVKAPVEESPPA